MNTTQSPKALGWSAAVGLFPGYDKKRAPEPEEVRSQRERLSAVWHENMKIVESQTGLFVSAIITPGDAIYPEEFGGPLNGEPVCIVSGSSNPKFVTPEQLPLYRQAVISIITNVMRDMRQSTSKVDFHEICDCVYLSPN